MNVSLVSWLVFLTLMTDLCQTFFEILERDLTAKEGSCITIECRATENVDPHRAHWFWMKDAQWIDNEFKAETVYSNKNISGRHVSEEYAHRVKYLGTFSSTTPTRSSKGMTCSISICDLKKSDNGSYSFRFVGIKTWKTKSDATLTVTENPCLIKFDKPPVVKENQSIALKCSTPVSCHSNPQITLPKDFSQLRFTDKTEESGNLKSTTVEFNVNWLDDKKEFLCQTDGNTGERKIQLIVEYAPKDTAATTTGSPDVNEGQSVTLTCSTRGRPNPTFTWFKDQQQVSSEPQLQLDSIDISQAGQYYCKTENIHGTNTSNTVIIDVKHKPRVEIIPRAHEFTEGHAMVLECNVTASKPNPINYTWLKDGAIVSWSKTHVVDSMRPEDRGFYRCRATNTLGTGISVPHEIMVNYKPRNTNITIEGSNTNTVKVNALAALICKTDAYPAPFKYEWNCSSKQECSKETDQNRLILQHVQRKDDLCYTCTATNTVNTGDRSNPVCMKVLYPPTKPTLRMKTEIREDQLIDITCTVESFPLSSLTLTWTSKSTPLSQKQLSTNSPWHSPNTLHHMFNVTSTHEGFYTCSAKNSEGSNSIKTELVVKYSPKNVKIKAQPEGDVNEKEQLVLNCVTKSNPPVTSVTWMKVIDGKDEVIRRTPTFTVTSASPSDSGRYSCTATNAIGAGKSQHYEVNVKYAPKHTQISTSAEQQRRDGTSFVTLSCSSQSFPRVHKYAWYREIKDKPMRLVSHNQNYTVPSDQPGKYYCIAKNSINEKMSEGVEVFLGHGFLKFLPYILAFVAVVVLLLIFLRSRRNKAVQQQASNTRPWWSCFYFTVPCGGPRRGNLVNESCLAEPCRSRDDLLPQRSRCPQSGPRQPHQDSTSASDITTVYCMAQPVRNQGQPAQKPVRQQGAHQHDDSVNYASLHFVQNNKQQKVGDDVYARIVKQKTPKKEEQGVLEDYENICGNKPSNGNYDTDEDEVEVNYSKVKFKAKPGHQRAIRGSDEEEEDTQYSQVKI